jgi:Uma2 family endonuclease
MVERTPPQVAGPVTYADYLALDDGQRYEVVAGELLVTPAPVPRHQIVVGDLHFLLSAWVRPRKVGRVLLAPTDVVLSDTDVVQPDVLFISRARLAIVGARAIEAAPDLVIEVLSPSTRSRDRGPKLAAYARCGVAEHWLVEPDALWIEIRRRAGEGLELAATLRRGDRLETPLLPGFELALDALFAEDGLDDGAGEAP